jgi:Ca-activated chloride channel homolog
MVTSLPLMAANRIIIWRSMPILRKVRISMTIRLGSGWRRIAAVTIGLAAVLVTSAAYAQQGPPMPPNLIVPGKQGSNSSTLELPSMPARQGGDSLTIAPNVPQPGQELVIPSRELREQPGYEQVTVTVTDSNGRYITGLQKDDFKLFLDGQQRPIEFFRQDLNTPVSVGILVDTSGSMVPKIPQARAAISQFLHDLNDKDDVFLFAFSTHPFLLQPFTTNHELVMNRLGLLHAYGNTAIFDTIMQGLSMVQHGRYDKKAILLVTDGMDNSSSATINDVAAAARRMGVLVYSIGIGDPNAGSAPSIMIGPFLLNGGDIEKVDAETLRKLSTETGAKTYIIREVGDGEVLRHACETISLELREQYTVGFLAPNPSAGGYRSLRVDVPGQAGADVRVRKGIEVGANPATPSAATAP